MGSKKEKTPEEELVDKLVGSGSQKSDNLKKVLKSSFSRNELQEIVQGAWKNGNSISEIRKVYVDNLVKFKSSDEEINESEPLYKNVTFLIATIIIICLVVGGIYSIFFMQYTYTSFNEFEIDGVSFNIPSDYELSAAGEDGDSFFNKYITEYTMYYGDGEDREEITKYINLEVYVYKNKSVQQVISSISSEGWSVHNTSYGTYSGYELEHPMFEGCWFIFKKDGKTVAFYCERKAIKDNIERIIG
ncbi:MAG: hypothetical protein LBU74_06535 [Methanobacteriaceae archaeon]|jgi:hypothetical protein|nr:hypothetical protein [Candidatus Methanorudis spinitermitis]